MFANEVGSQEPVSSKNLQDKNIPKPANPAKKRNHASIHIYSNMLPKLRPEVSYIYPYIYQSLASWIIFGLILMGFIVR